MASKLIAAIDIKPGVACVQQNLQTIQLIAADSLPQRLLYDTDDEDLYIIYHIVYGIVYKYIRIFIFYK
jgi:hypothetical protein